MTQSDITIERLADVGAGDAAYLVSKIRTIPGFPKEGIKFRDFMPVLADGKGLRILMKALQASLPVTEDSFDAVAGWRPEVPVRPRPRGHARQGVHRDP